MRFPTGCAVRALIQPAGLPNDGTLKEMMDSVERQLLAKALSERDHNKTRTAQHLGMTREGLHKKLARHGMT